MVGTRRGPLSNSGRRPPGKATDEVEQDAFQERFVLICNANEYPLAPEATYDDRVRVRRHPHTGGPGTTQPSGGQEGAEKTDAPRRDARGQLPLAAREGGARGHGVPRRGERLHRGRDRTPRRAAGDALQGDARTHQGDRTSRCRARGRLLVLHAHRERKGVSDLLPPEGLAHAPEEVYPRSERARRGQEVPRARRPGCQSGRHEADLPGGPDGVSRVHAVRQGSRLRQDSRVDPEGVERHRVGQRQQDVFLHDARRGQARQHRLAARHRHAQRRRTSRCSRRTTSSTTSRLPVAKRRVRLHHRTTASRRRNGARSRRPPDRRRRGSSPRVGPTWSRRRARRRLLLHG